MIHVTSYKHLWICHLQRVDLKVNVSCCEGCRRKVMKAMSLKGAKDHSILEFAVLLLHSPLLFAFLRRDELMFVFSIPWVDVQAC